MPNVDRKISTFAESGLIFRAFRSCSHDVKAVEESRVNQESSGSIKKELLLRHSTSGISSRDALTLA